VTVVRLVDAPPAGDVVAVSPELLYLALPGAVLAVVTWNAAVGRSGAQNVALIGNLIPVVTFAIQVVRGYRPVALELAGAALTVGALTANNLLLRRRAPGAAADDEPEELLEAA
jgi:drug/metabolite transporter (DMT)-like permease